MEVAAGGSAVVGCQIARVNRGCKADRGGVRRSYVRAAVSCGGGLALRQQGRVPGHSRKAGQGTISGEGQRGREIEREDCVTNGCRNSAAKPCSLARRLLSNGGGRSLA